ncbi:MAG: hypothetical protein JWM56_689 [Candidatus Peribacteria bacterium]|nr:hypothetical protein [Candidatus Peribacteria bacterium]
MQYSSIGEPEFPVQLSRRQALGALAGLSVSASGLASRAAEISLPKNVFVTDPTVFPYDLSPLSFHLSLQERYIPANTKAKLVLDIANSIADNVKAAMCTEVQRQFPNLQINSAVSLRITAASQDLLREYMRIISKHILDEGYVYGRDCSYHDGIVQKEQTNVWPLDCDLTSHLAMHVAEKHGMPIAYWQQWEHLCLCAVRGDDIYEMTELGTAGFIQSKKTRREQGQLTPRANELLGFYYPMSQVEVKQGIAGNIVYEMHRSIGKEQYPLPALDQLCKSAEEILRDYGESFLTVYNLCWALDHTVWQYGEILHPAAEHVRKAQRYRDRKELLERTYAQLLRAPKERKPIP